MGGVAAGGRIHSGQLGKVRAHVGAHMIGPQPASGTPPTRAAFSGTHDLVPLSCG